MELEKYISEIKKYKKLSSYKGKYEITPGVHNCAGNVPPPLMGATTTFMNGRVYLYGGKHITSSTINTEIYIFYLESKKWRHVKDYKNNQLIYNEKQKHAKLRALEYESIRNTKLKRYFHSAVAYKTFLIFFGGITMLNEDPDTFQPQQFKPNLPTPSKFFGIRGKSIPVFKMIMNSQSSLTSRKSISRKPKAKRLLLNDMAVFDTENEVWIDVKNIQSLNSLMPELTPDEPISPRHIKINRVSFNGRDKNSMNLEVMLPQPRYAHLACMIYEDKMVIIGGQGLSEEYIKEFNVYDFSTHRWVCKRILDSEISTYRSAIVSLPAGSALVYSSYPSPTGIECFMYTINPSPQFSFGKNKANGDLDVPGFKFPSMNIINRSCIFFTGVLTDSKEDPKLSIWSYNPLSSTWKEMFSSSDAIKGVWENPIVCGTTQNFILFGDSKKILDKEYNSFKNSFSQCMEINLVVLGLSRLDTARSDVTLREFVFSETENIDSELEALSAALQKSSDILESAQNLGLLALSMSQLSDIWLETTDGKLVPVSSALLKVRSQSIIKSWRIGTGITRYERKNTESYSYISNDSIIQIDGLNKHSVQKKTSTSRLINLKNSKNIDRILVPEVSDVIVPLIKFLYTGVLEVIPALANAKNNNQPDAVKRRVITILSRLIFLGQNWDLTELTSAAVLLLRQQINSNTALYVLDAVHKLKMPEIESLCLSVIRNSINYKGLQESYIWNNISESTRYYVESKIADS